MIQITARHMFGGENNEHIAEVKWQAVNGTSSGRTSREEMVKWLDSSDDNKAIVGNYSSDYVYVGTVHPKYSHAYIRTYANGEWTDNLLSLPKY